MIDHEIYQRSELLVQNMIEIIDHPPYDNSARVATSANLCQMSIEHSCAFRNLSEHRMFVSSFVVLRAQFEAVLRAVWALYCATDDHIQRLSTQLSADNEQSAKNLPQAQDMLRALGLVPAAKIPFDALSEFKDSSWRALNSFTHAGIHPLSRQIGGYPLGLVIDNVKISNGLAMIAAMQFCILTGAPSLQAGLIPLHERFQDCLPIHRVGA